MLVRIANGIINLPQVMGMLRIYLVGGGEAERRGIKEGPRKAAANETLPICTQLTFAMLVASLIAVTFYIQVVFKIFYQAVSKIVVYKIDVGLVRELAKRDGTFQMEGVANVFPYSVPNAVTLAVREKVEQKLEVRRRGRRKMHFVQHKPNLLARRCLLRFASLCSSPAHPPARLPAQ